MALAVSAGSALAQTPGVNLSWDDCGSAGVQNKSVATCASSNTGQQVIYASFVAPAGLTLKSAVLWFGFVSATPAMPAWWTIGDPPSCRPGPIDESGTGLSVSPRVPCAAATDYWGTIPGGPFGGAAYTVNPALGLPHMVPGANHAGLRAEVTVDQNFTYAINGGEEYYLLSLTLKNSGSTTCAGCDVPVCILFNLLELSDPPTALSGPPTGGRDFVTWQGGVSAPCAEVPVRNVTWGRVKTLYR